MAVTTRFVPPAGESGGGTLFGNSYLSTWAACRREFFNLNVRPSLTSDGAEAQGITPIHTKENFLRGSDFHEGIAAWLISGCRDGEDTGEYDIERALEVMEAHHAERLWQWKNPIEAEKSRLQIRELLRRYHDEYGPGGRRPQYPYIKVVCDGKGEPLIEKAFDFPLGYLDYVYSARLDAIIEVDGYLKIFEHKTSSAGFVKQRLRTIHMDSQFTGQLWILEKQFPEEVLYGCYVNIVAKNRAPRGSTPRGKQELPLATRELTTRTHEQLARFPIGVITMLKEIDEAVEEFTGLRQKGLDIEAAADVVFPLDGTHTQHCYAYNSECDYMLLCKEPGLESQILRGMRGRTKVETTRDKEHAE